MNHVHILRDGYYVNIKNRKKEFLYTIKGINLGHQTYKFKGTCLSQTFSQHRIRKSSSGVLALIFAASYCPAILEPTAPKYVVCRFLRSNPTIWCSKERNHILRQHSPRQWRHLTKAIENQSVKE
jgi:hypothetical protein